MAIYIKFNTDDVIFLKDYLDILYKHFKQI